MPAVDHELRLLVEKLNATIYGGVSGVTPTAVGTGFYPANPPFDARTVNAGLLVAAADNAATLTAAIPSAGKADIWLGPGLFKTGSVTVPPAPTPARSP